MLAPFARIARSVTPLEERALLQAFREPLLAQSSDFAFILKSGTVASYARSRVESHLPAVRRPGRGASGRARSTCPAARGAGGSPSPSFRALNLATLPDRQGD